MVACLNPRILYLSLVRHYPASRTAARPGNPGAEAEFGDATYGLPGLAPGNDAFFDAELQKGVASKKP